MKKIVVVHGALNTSNFGDVLFASLFMRRLEQNDDVIPFFLEMPRFGVGEFVRKELNYTRNITRKEKYHADVLVYMSGGYFGDARKSALGAVRRWMRYAAYGTYMRKRKKDILICGVGGGPLYAAWLRKSAVQIMNAARYISMRDEQSRRYFLEAGVSAPIEVTADTALSIRKKDLPVLEEKRELEALFGQKNRLVVHLVMDKTADRMFAERVVPAIKRLLEERRGLGIIFVTDSVCSYSGLLSYHALRAAAALTYPYKYSSAWQLCALLDSADAVITMKLHVGIVSAALEKPVVAFPMHPHKTKRFYEQIGESGRCAQLSEVDAQKAYEMLKNYMDKKIIMPENLRRKAEENLLVLDAI